MFHGRLDYSMNISCENEVVKAWIVPGRVSDPDPYPDPLGSALI